MTHTEGSITRLLAEKHWKDIFIAQCKTGQSWGLGLQILDAWVLPRSWVKPVWGYEIKVSRSDFKRDDKWRVYLEYCHRFAFVVPHGMIVKEEIPDEAGLLWTSKDGKRLRWVKYAPTRDVQIPTSIFHYVLIWRAAFDGSAPPIETEPAQLPLSAEAITRD